MVDEYPETHQNGSISIEMELKQGMIVGDLGVQIGADGRVWICLGGRALIRFKPHINKNCKQNRVNSQCGLPYCDNCIQFIK